MAVTLTSYDTPGRPGSTMTFGSADASCSSSRAHVAASYGTQSFPSWYAHSAGAGAAMWTGHAKERATRKS